MLIYLLNQFTLTNQEMNLKKLLKAISKIVIKEPECKFGNRESDFKMAGFR